MSRPVCVQRTGRRTETSYKAESLGKAAQHVKALDSGDTVNGAEGLRKFTFLSGETCLWCGIDSCSVRLPDRGYRYPKVLASPGKGFRLEKRYESKESRQDRDLSSAIQGNLCGEEAGVSRGHSRRRKLS